MKFRKSILIFSSILLPITAFAQTTTGSCVSSFRTIADILNFVVCLISKSVIPLLFMFALALFIYGVVNYLIHADDSAKRTEGSKFMLWGVIALFVMLSVWGLVGIIRNTFNVKNVIPQLPQN